MSAHVEFPKLTPEAIAAVEVAYESVGKLDRRHFAAFLREAIRQADPMPGSEFAGRLTAIAANLHSPPPPAPTLAEAKEAARQLAGPSAEIVHAFLSSLEVKP